MFTPSAVLPTSGASCGTHPLSQRQKDGIVPVSDRSALPAPVTFISCSEKENVRPAKDFFAFGSVPATVPGQTRFRFSGRKFLSAGRTGEPRKLPAAGTKKNRGLLFFAENDIMNRILPRKGIPFSWMKIT